MRVRTSGKPIYISFLNTRRATLSLTVDLEPHDQTDFTSSMTQMEANCHSSKSTTPWSKSTPSRGTCSAVTSFFKDWITQMPKKSLSNKRRCGKIWEVMEKTIEFTSNLQILPIGNFSDSSKSMSCKMLTHSVWTSRNWKWSSITGLTPKTWIWGPLPSQNQASMKYWTNSASSSKPRKNAASTSAVFISTHMAPSSCAMTKTSGRTQKMP